MYASRELSLGEGAATAPSIPELAREYVAIIRRQQPRGPYRIGGMSFGGIVAYEVAQQLQDEGEQVPLYRKIPLFDVEVGGHVYRESEAEEPGAEPVVARSEGWPIGIQFIGAYGDEAKLLALAGDLEKAMPWEHRRPTVFAR